jgi:hypothetical protein
MNATGTPHLGKAPVSQPVVDEAENGFVVHKLGFGALSTHTFTTLFLQLVYSCSGFSFAFQHFELLL